MRQKRKTKHENNAQLKLMMPKKKSKLYEHSERFETSYFEGKKQKNNRNLYFILNNAEN